MSFFTQLNNVDTGNTIKHAASELANGKTYHVSCLKPVSNNYGDTYYFTVAEMPGAHFFSGKPVTRKFDEIWAAGMADELKNVECEFVKRHADSYDQDYIDVVFKG